ncbi:Na+/Ca2+-antiporter [Salinarchaeum sp. Harcht-Bsk1]|uniref:sodium:calcium antiporter n=1 Tax=Salinarchaeum sp. Harcht-Bsk1 TaxID=1333523 RepID=UPI0003423D21|nr:sodium:calcium antiporter [Salinarchaeum sp. Harcht-Bsk1]AGN02545.1 Na+/Ca2+-antiporter [Salinarchaeum sp. Harcht-Bsk1]
MVISGIVPDVTPVHLVVIAIASVAVWIGSAWLETSAEDLSAYYGLPPVVQGSVVVAVGSSFPEFASVVIAAFAGAFDLGVGAIVGSALFNVLVIPALSGLSTEGEELDANRAIVYKEAQFYMIAVSALIITFALAVIYEPVESADALSGEITRPLAVIPLLLYGLYLFIQWQDVGDHTPGDEGEGVDVLPAWGKLAAGLLVILVAVEFLVGSVEFLGAALGVPEFLAGVTILAAATSLPDTLVSVRSASGGNGTTSLGNVLGSNTFDLLVAIPVGVVLVGSLTINFAVALPLFGVLTLATVLLFTFLRTDLTLYRWESYLLLLAYAVFVAWMVTESIGATDLLKAA